MGSEGFRRKECSLRRLGCKSLWPVLKILELSRLMHVHSLDCKRLGRGLVEMILVMWCREEGIGRFGLSPIGGMSELLYLFQLRQ